MGTVEVGTQQGSGISPDHSQRILSTMSSILWYPTGVDIAPPVSNRCRYADDFFWRSASERSGGILGGKKQIIAA